MALIWGGGSKTTKESPNPSPTSFDKLPGFARNQGKKRQWKNVWKRRLIGEPSPFTLLWKRMEAGVTVEAAIILPICLFFLINLGSAVEMIRLHNNLQMALWDTGDRLALYGCEQGENEAASWISGFYIRNRILDYVGENYLDQSPLARGSRSLQLWESDMLEGDRLDIKLTYSVEPVISLAGFRGFRMANRYTVHLWNGYDLTGETEKGQVVYMTEYGEVWHRDRNCTYLQLTIKDISRDAVGDARNRWGDRYTACGKCREEEMPEVVYVTPDGVRFHWSSGCPGLKRTVRAVPVAEAEGYPPCSRCGGR